MRILIILFIGFIGLCGETLYKKGSFVKDISHNLMWQDTKDNTFMLGSQEEAIIYCENLSLGGYKNWELPTKKQYEYIIDNNRKDKLKIHKAFKNVVEFGYWSSSRTWRNFGKYGYYFLVKSGSLYYENRTYSKFFRCVRDVE